MAPTTPTGAVQFQVDGSDDGLPATLDGSGHATYTPTYPIDVGATVTATYSGDRLHETSSADFDQNVLPAATKVSLSSSSNPQTVGQQVVFTASVTNMNTTIVPFGSIQFSIDGTPVLEPLQLDFYGEAAIAGTPTTPGDSVIEATYHDDTGYPPDFTDSRASLMQHVIGTSSPASASPGAPPVTTVTPVNHCEVHRSRSQGPEAQGRGAQARPRALPAGPRHLQESQTAEKTRDSTFEQATSGHEASLWPEGGTRGG
jgi:hypothetical protein